MSAVLHRFSLRIPLIALMLATLLGSALLSGCATDSLARDETLKWSADRLYAEAKDEMGSGNWAAAIKLLEKLESRYPFGRYAQQAQIDTAYAHWKENENALALAAIDRFMKLYPNHDNVDYVLYLKGLINFNDRGSLFTSVTGEDLSERDPKAAREAFDSFKELVTRFPKSQYAGDASERMSFLINMLASNEVHVARFYMRRGATLAAVNRAQAVVKQYQDAPAIEEALAIMMVGYQQLGLSDLSGDAKRVLVKNFPNSVYLKTGYDPKIRGGTESARPGLWTKFNSSVSKLKPW
jgi:outer membrane protein assembly factor BamD